MIPDYLLHWVPRLSKRSRGRPRKNWLSCVLEDAALFSVADNITMNVPALYRVQWRGSYALKREVSMRYRPLQRLGGDLSKYN